MRKKNFCFHFKEFSWIYICESHGMDQFLWVYCDRNSCTLVVVWCSLLTLTLKTRRMRYGIFWKGLHEQVVRVLIFALTLASDLFELKSESINIDGPMLERVCRFDFYQTVIKICSLQGSLIVWSLENLKSSSLLDPITSSVLPYVY